MTYPELCNCYFSETFLYIMPGFLCFCVFHSNIWTLAQSCFYECLILASVPYTSSILNLVLKCFTSRNVFPVCRAVRSLHQQVFTTPVNLLSGGESPSFYHRRLGEHFVHLFKFFYGEMQINHLFLNYYDKDRVLCKSYLSWLVGCQGTRADPVESM